MTAEDSLKKGLRSRTAILMPRISNNQQLKTWRPSTHIATLPTLRWLFDATARAVEYRAPTELLQLPRASLVPFFSVYNVQRAKRDGLYHHFREMDPNWASLIPRSHLNCKVQRWRHPRMSESESVSPRLRTRILKKLLFHVSMDAADMDVLVATTRNERCN